MARLFETRPATERQLARWPATEHYAGASARACAHPVRIGSSSTASARGTGTPDCEFEESDRELPDGPEPRAGQQPLAEPIADPMRSQFDPFFSISYR